MKRHTNRNQEGKEINFDKLIRHKIRTERRVQKPRKEFKCDCCEYSAFYQTNLRIHFNEVHKKLIQYQCKKCQKCFKLRIQLKKHIVKKHLRKRRLQCPQCEAFFGTDRELVHHINSAHSYRVHM